MFGLIEVPSDDSAMSILFFTKEEEAQNYINLFKEKNPNETIQFLIVKISKHHIFDANAESADTAYYKFDPTMNDDE
jgi:hypothetical protein